MENDFFLKQINESYQYFNHWLYSNESLDENESIVKNSIYCKLHDKFWEDHLATTNDPESYLHNCIGCGLDEGANNVNYFLETNKECNNIRYYLTIYSLLFYIQAEKIGVIYNEIGFRTHKNEFDWNQFPNLKMIKNWANFFKHPKSYMFLHHPTFYLESDSNNPNFMLTEIIDNNFIQQFYKAGAKNDELRNKLINQENVKVFFPDLLSTTKLLCEEFEKIITLIINDELIFEKLKIFNKVDYDTE